MNLLNIINKGEGVNVDFKRLLKLDTARNKSELVKDVIALANSSEYFGYLIIGVDDDKSIVGCSEPPSEEQIQQIINRYINPPVKLTLITVKLEKDVLVLKIKATKKPHKVSRDIEKVLKDTVFVRHGSVIFKASPEEIIEMSKSSSDPVSSLVDSAASHEVIGNYKTAIDKISEAIHINPASYLYVKLASLQIKFLENSDLPYTEKDVIGQECANQLTKSLLLDPDDDLEVKIRFLRFELWCRHYGLSYKYSEREKEYDWLQKNLHGYDLGKLLFLDLLDTDNNCGIEEYKEHNMALGKVLMLGYKEAEVYFLRSLSNHYDFNHGLALQDLEEYARIVDKIDEKAYCSLKINYLVCLRRYEEAISVIEKARRKLGEEFTDSYLGSLEVFWKEDMYNTHAVFIYLMQDPELWAIDALKAFPPNNIDDKKYPQVDSIINAVLNR